MGNATAHLTGRLARVGVGFRGMRERVRQFGGKFEIQSDANGRNVTAIFPIEAQAEAGQTRAAHATKAS